MAVGSQVPLAEGTNINHVGSSGECVSPREGRKC